MYFNLSIESWKVADCTKYSQKINANVLYNCYNRDKHSLVINHQGIRGWIIEVNVLFIAEDGK